MRYVLPALVCVLGTFICHASGFGSQWERVIFGQPIRDGSLFALDDSGIWAIGGWHGLSFSDDGVEWNQVAGLPEYAFAPEAFLRLASGYSVISYKGFWHATYPNTSWAQITEEPVPTIRTRETRYLGYSGRIYSVGGHEGSGPEDTTEVWSTVDGSDWRLENSSPPFTERRMFGAQVFNGKMWLLPGQATRLFQMANDIWSSTDGIEWHREVESAPWAPRSGYASAVFNGRMYVVGGYSSGNVFSGGEISSDVWSTADGVVWRQEPATNEAMLWLAAQPPSYGRVPETFVWKNQLYVTGGRMLATWRTADGVHWEFVPNSNPWAQSGSFASVSFKGMAYLLGGENDLGVNSSVWRTADGEDWELVLRSAPWAARRGHAAVVKDGFIWVYGGASRDEILSDVWRSPDGISWEKVTSNADWGPRYFFGAAAVGGYLWLAGGLDATPFGEGVGRSDIWRSMDGVTWESVVTEAPWGPLFSMGMASHDDSLWIVGGTRVSATEVYGTYTAWSSPDGVTWTMAAPNTGFSASVPALRSYAGKLWLSGGLVYSFRNDDLYNKALWNSEDGITWSKVGEDMDWLARNAHGMEFLGNRLLIFGGVDSDDRAFGDIWISQGDIPHQTADTNADLRLDISELLRLIQFYNAGALHTADGTEDGFAPGVGDTADPPHQSDYNPQDWKIDLPELLRAIQFYNAGGYTPCEAGEDGFCPGP